MCACVFVYICGNYTCVHVHMHTYLKISSYIHMNTCIYIPHPLKTYARMYTRIYHIKFDTLLCLHVYIPHPLKIYAHMYTCIYHIHSYTLLYIYMYTRVYPSPLRIYAHMYSVYHILLYFSKYIHVHMYISPTP